MYTIAIVIVSVAIGFIIGGMFGIAVCSVLVANEWGWDDD